MSNEIWSWAIAFLFAGVIMFVASIIQPGFTEYQLSDGSRVCCQSSRNGGTFSGPLHLSGCKGNTSDYDEYLAQTNVKVLGDCMK